jgi:transposase-like protein
MVEHITGASEPQGFFDIRLGVRRRRLWSDEVKREIVAQSYAPGAVVSQVARQHRLSPQQLSAWRKAARTGALELSAQTMLQFVPVATKQQHDIAIAVAESPDKITPAHNESSSSRQARAALACPDPRQKFIEPRGRPEIDQLGEHVGEINLRVDATELAGLDERGNAGPVLGAMIMAGEQCILAIMQTSA